MCHASLLVVDGEAQICFSTALTSNTLTVQAAGFHNVKEIQYKWPIGTWPKDARQKQLGKMTMMNMSSGLEGMLPPTLAEDRQANGVQGFTLRLWTGVLGMEHDAVLVDLVDVRKDIASSKVHAYWPM